MQESPEIILEKFIDYTNTPPEGVGLDGFDMLVSHYSAKYSDIRLALKVVDGVEYPRDRRDVIAEAKSFTAAAAAQGVALPLFAGLFTDGTTYCPVYKDPGSPVTYDQLQNPETM
jgi:hypothetical protein